MDPKKIKNPEHREYLEIKDNPVKVSSAAIFTLVSESMTKLDLKMTDLDKRMAIVETKQDLGHESMLNLDKSVRGFQEKTEEKINILEDDFSKCQLTGIGSRGGIDERFKWLFRAIALIMTLSIASLVMLISHLGVELPFP